jgi:hypothetical protein
MWLMSSRFLWGDVFLLLSKLTHYDRNKSANKQLAKDQAKSRNRIFSKRDEQAKKKRKEREQQASGS